MSIFLRKIMLLCLFSCIGMIASAADYVSVKVSNAEGEATYFALEERPVVSFSANALVLTTTKQVVEYPLSMYRKFEFSETTDISSLVAEKQSAIFYFGETLKAEGLEAGSPLMVYTVNGQLIGKAVANSNGMAEVSLNGNTGIFVVKTLSKTFKFIVK